MALTLNENVKTEGFQAWEITCSEFCFKNINLGIVWEEMERTRVGRDRKQGNCSTLTG